MNTLGPIILERCPTLRKLKMYIFHLRSSPPKIEWTPLYWTRMTGPLFGVCIYIITILLLQQELYTGLKKWELIIKLEALHIEDHVSNSISSFPSAPLPFWTPQSWLQIWPESLPASRLWCPERVWGRGRRHWCSLWRLSPDISSLRFQLFPVKKSIFVNDTTSNTLWGRSLAQSVWNVRIIT